MITNTELTGLDNNTLEIHYWLDNNSHLMNANIENKCSYEILAIIKQVATIFAADVVIETEALGEGGLRRWLRVSLKEEDKKGSITTAVIVALVTTLLISPVEKFSEKFIDKCFEDTELQDLQKQKLKLEILKLEEETSVDKGKQEDNIYLKKRRSNFYENLEKEPKIEKVSFSTVDSNKQIITKEKTVFKSDFKNFILATDDIDSLDTDEAVIEIIAPVLKKGKYKWIGLYQGKPIDFNMKSIEFKVMVQKGEIEFRNGSSINCFLQIKRKVNSDGSIINVGFDVLRVNKYFENENPIETLEGRHYRQMKEAEKKQLKLFSAD